MNYYKFDVRYTQFATVCIEAENRGEAIRKMADSWAKDEGFWRAIEHEMSRNDANCEYEFISETDDVYGVTID